MPDAEDNSESHATPIRGREYTSGSRARHRSDHGIQRLFFFSLASIWGFIVGVAGLLAAMSAAGQPVQLHSGAILGLIPALVLAAAGAVVMAGAYKESKRRSR